MSEQKIQTKTDAALGMYCYGGTYFYCGAVMGRKNIFVTDNIIELLVNAFKMTEVRKDIKNLAYVIMPNFFYWIFRLSEKQNNPVLIYGELKKELTREILRNLVDEAKGNLRCDLAPVFRANEHVGRSAAGKILGVFETAAKESNSEKKFKVWLPHTELRLLDSDELLRQKISALKAIPVSERWQLAKKPEEYPYLYLADELSEAADENVKLRLLINSTGSS
jgi:REP element-mobilizing transposase RayT